MVAKYKVITLCGSTKFKDDFKQMRKKLSLEGNIVISADLLAYADGEYQSVKTEGIIGVLEDIQRKKIDMADEIMVINKNDYIDSHTKTEIEYAIKANKKVNYMETHKWILENYTKEDELSYSKIYGLDPGSIEQVELYETMEPIELYSSISMMDNYIRKCEFDMSRGKMAEIDLTEDRYALEFLIYQSTKFGVELPKPQRNKHIAITPSFNAWYSFYDNYFKNNLTDEQWEAFQEAKEKGSSFIPDENWQDTLGKPLIKGLSR